ncbi:substrate-binding periplasmic protein [Sneathiella glossodoripedis]|uniref:substrate-binding periplasmic protein n=1 Tax=Sneathiella glossodoripedis TaxID=418853 RepID=UPI00131F2D51|nr:transporter substrate-binding domain-containing protein [Sneathiella glossodoripedis]
MKSLFLGLSISVVLSVSGGTSLAVEEKTELEIACSHFPPSKIEGAPDGRRGHDIDFLIAAFENSDYDLNVRYMPWKRATERVRNGQSDALCACSYQPEREDWILFSDQLGLQEVGYFYNPKTTDGQVQDPNLLFKKSIGVVRSYNLHKELLDANRKVVPVVSSETGLEMLIERRIYSFYSFRNTSQYILSRLPGGRDIQYHPVRKSPYYMCFSRLSPHAIDAREQFNKGMREIIYSGEYERILDNYR